VRNLITTNKKILVVCLFTTVLATVCIHGCSRFAYAKSKFTQTLLVYYGGGKAFKPGDEEMLAKFDILDVDRFRYDDIAGKTWKAIKHINPKIRIFLYQNGPETYRTHDSRKGINLNDIGRYGNARSHPMGSLSGNPKFILKDSSGKPICRRECPNRVFLDFGQPAFQRYWIQATLADIVYREWKADGVFVDNCMAGYPVEELRHSNKYADVKSYNKSMNSYLNAITRALHEQGQQVFVNRGNTRSETGYKAWLDLDRMGNPPDIVMEEGAFAVHWGKGDVQFYPEKQWRRQLDIVRKIRHSEIAYLSHTDLDVGESGFDNYSKPATFWQIFRYALASYQLAKTENPNRLYFMFQGNCRKGSYKKIWWFREYDSIDFGKPLSSYKIESIQGTNIYYREFQKGYVFVNPTPKDILSVPLPTSCIQIKSGFDQKRLSGLSCVNQIELPAHHGVFLYKILSPHE